MSDTTATPAPETTTPVAPAAGTPPAAPAPAGKAKKPKAVKTPAPPKPSRTEKAFETAKTQLTGAGATYVGAVDGWAPHHEFKATLPAGGDLLIYVNGEKPSTLGVYSATQFAGCDTKSSSVEKEVPQVDEAGKAVEKDGKPVMKKVKEKVEVADKEGDFCKTWKLGLVEVIAIFNPTAAAALQAAAAPAPAAPAAPAPAPAPAAA